MAGNQNLCSSSQNATQITSPFCVLQCVLLSTSCPAKDMAGPTNPPTRLTLMDTHLSNKKSTQETAMISISMAMGHSVHGSGY